MKQYRSLIPELSGVSYNFNDASHVLRTDINICHCIPEMIMHCTKAHKRSKIKVKFSKQNWRRKPAMFMLSYTILKNNVPKRCDFKHGRKQEP